MVRMVVERVAGAEPRWGCMGNSPRGGGGLGAMCYSNFKKQILLNLLMYLLGGKYNPLPATVQRT